MKLQLSNSTKVKPLTTSCNGNKSYQELFEITNHQTSASRNQSKANNLTYLTATGNIATILREITSGLKFISFFGGLLSFCDSGHISKFSLITLLLPIGLSSLTIPLSSVEPSRIIIFQDASRASRVNGSNQNTNKVAAHKYNRSNKST